MASTGRIIKNLLDMKSINQKDLADMTGITEATISRYINGTREPKGSLLRLIADKLNVSVDYLMGMEGANNGKYLIPVFSQVAAGNPIFASDEIIDYEEIPIEWKDKGEFFAVRLKGDSMLPRFAEGDVVIVRKQDSVDSGDLAIVLVNGDEATFKKVELLDNGIVLIALNSAVYTPKVYTNDDIERLLVRIIGKVVEARIKL